MQTRRYRKQKESKSGLGYWLKYKFATEFDQNIQAMVYFGAAFLVIIVGLRGLGDLGDVSFIPNFLLDSNGKIDAHIVMVGLIVEFLMLCLLAAVSFFTPVEKRADLQASIEKLSKSVEKLSENITEFSIRSFEKDGLIAPELITPIDVPMLNPPSHCSFVIYMVFIE